ncbi:MAG: sulfite exporter TauE/SafE family protein [Geobacter sp.]|nr:sulfite exporter TauE/SafE family protein [Geobacter sp.]
MIEVWLAFLTGLAGTGHCIGMCGAVAGAVALHDNNQSVGNRVLFGLSYNLGRIATYATLGAAAGLAGASFNAAVVREVSFISFAGANLMVVATGLVHLLGRGDFFVKLSGGCAAAIIQKPLSLALKIPRYPRAFCSGLVLGFLPCGLVYAAVAAAAGSGSGWKGMAIVGALGAGTIPALIFVSVMPACANLGANAVLRRFVGLGLVLLGVAGLWRLLGKLGYLPGFPFW